MTLYELADKRGAAMLQSVIPAKAGTTHSRDGSIEGARNRVAIGPGFCRMTEKERGEKRALESEPLMDIDHDPGRKIAGAGHYAL
jgi:hypothetical protein